MAQRHVALFAELVELADTSDLGSDVLWRKGSSPLFGTKASLPSGVFGDYTQ